MERGAPMKALHIDFAPRSWLRALRTTRPIIWVLGCAGLVLCVSAAVAAVRLLQEQALQAMELQRVQAQWVQRAARQPAPIKFPLSETQATAVNGAVAQLNLPWRDVLDAVETATPATIALLSLEPDARKRLLRGSAEAKTSDTMIAYIGQLKQQAYFASVVLTKHEINEQDPNKPLRFQFEAQWTGSVE
jgi:Tfp pilus assembly protein PilN